ncbi:MAG: ferredoxin oxidoreductase beta subunit, partial [Phenylobacterium sp.]|jgi:2-oxoglutarate ferredoxin oxidoreductase subunit beta|nr:ferredoxin oxidoreductase beta subunit [Phenylobacterium sp.]
VREHNDAVNRMDVIPHRETITVDYAPGETVPVAQHDGSVVHLHKLAEHYDPSDRVGALAYLQARQALGEIVTGLLFLDPEARDLHENLGTVEAPLNSLTERELTPGSAALERLNASLR